MENRFKVQAVTAQFGRAEYKIKCTISGKVSQYAVGSWHDAVNQCAAMNGALPETQDREVNEFFV